MVQQGISQIRSDIENTKAHLSETMNELEDRFDEIKHWRGLIRQYPLVSILVCVGTGFLLSARLGTVKHASQNYFQKTLPAALSTVLVKFITDRLMGRQSNLLAKPRLRL